MDSGGQKEVRGGGGWGKDDRWLMQQEVGVRRGPRCRIAFREEGHPPGLFSGGEATRNEVGPKPFQNSMVYEHLWQPSGHDACSRGLMDKASAFGAEDCAFESRREYRGGLAPPRLFSLFEYLFVF